MKRVTFDPSREVQQVEPQRRGNLCYAHGCRMAGDGADLGSDRFWCSYHRAAPLPEQIPLVSEALRVHGALVDVINDGQRMLNRDPFATRRHADYLRVNKEALAQMGYEVPPSRREDLSSFTYNVRSLLLKLVRQSLGAAA